MRLPIKIVTANESQAESQSACRDATKPPLTLTRVFRTRNTNLPKLGENTRMKHNGDSRIAVDRHG